MKDFFISYHRADRQWAEWIAWTLEEGGYSVILQAWDFRPGSNFVIEMQNAALEAGRTIAVLSEEYLAAGFTQPEWSAAFAFDPTGLFKKLVPVRVSKCEPAGLLAPIVYIDLVGLSADDARLSLFSAFTGRGKPDVPPKFPGLIPVGASESRHISSPSAPYPGLNSTSPPSIAPFFVAALNPKSLPDPR
jgi:hypothetical protein